MSPLCRECKDRAKTTTSDVSSMNDFCDRCGGPRSPESERPDPPRYMDPENEVEDGQDRLPDLVFRGTIDIDAGDRVDVRHHLSAASRRDIPDDVLEAHFARVEVDRIEYDGLRDETRVWFVEPPTLDKEYIEENVERALRGGEGDDGG